MLRFKRLTVFIDSYLTTTYHHYQTLNLFSICKMTSESKSNEQLSIDWKNKAPYIYDINNNEFNTKYFGKCDCGKISIECNSDPLDVKICHCRGCQKLHGAAMQIQPGRHHISSSAPL